MAAQRNPPAGRSAPAAWIPCGDPGSQARHSDSAGAQIPFPRGWRVAQGPKKSRDERALHRNVIGSPAAPSLDCSAVSSSVRPPRPPAPGRSDALRGRLVRSAPTLKAHQAVVPEESARRNLWIHNRLCLATTRDGLSVLQADRLAENRACHPSQLACSRRARTITFSACRPDLRLQHV